MSYSYIEDRVQDLEEKIAELKAENAKLRAVAEAAKAACFSPALLSDKTAMIMRMGELHAAIAKLEAVDV